MSKFSDKLESCRNARNINRTQLAKILGINEATIRNWIRDDIIPPADTLFKIAKFFGLPMEYFLDGEVSLSVREIGLIIKMKKLTDEQCKLISFVVDKFAEENSKQL